jgi:hypothetical protein
MLLVQRWQFDDFTRDEMGWALMEVHLRYVTVQDTDLIVSLG